MHFLRCRVWPGFKGLRRDFLWFQRRGIRYLKCDRIHDICRGFSQHGTLTDQVVCAFAAWIARGPRYGENVASLFKRKARGDQRARFQRGLDHQYPMGEARYQTVACREVAGGRSGARRLLGDENVRSALLHAGDAREAWEALGSRD